jgi:hypothetical protein
MGIGDRVGEIGICSDCHQWKKIALEWSTGTGRDGQVYSPFVRCEDCVKLELERKNTPYYCMK